MGAAIFGYDALDLLWFITHSLYLFLPAYFANMAPVICKKLNFLKEPVDGGLRIRGKPVFGKNKTWRGILCATAFGIAIAYLQYLLMPLMPNWYFFDYGIDYVWLKLGFLFGFGAILGDLLESFVKRQLDYPPGKPFVPFDQTDFIIGAILLGYQFIVAFTVGLAVLVITPILHILVNHIAFYTKIRKEKW